MKHSKVISHRRIEITQSSPFIPYELAHNYNYDSRSFGAYQRRPIASTTAVAEEGLHVQNFANVLNSKPIPTGQQGYCRLCAT